MPADGGLVRTTVDLALNRRAEQAIGENLRLLTDKHATAGAVVVIDNPTGEVLALACAASEADRSAADVNGAWMIRSPGSAMKPFTYLLALERGANPCTVVPDVPTDFPTPDGVYRPNNYNHRFYGPVSLRFALGNSLNVSAIRVLEMAGGPEALQHLMGEAGVTTLDHPSDYYGLGLTLGNGEVRLLELANAFATFGRLGVYRPFRLLLRDGAASVAPKRIFDRTAAYLLGDMLSDHAARAASFGLTSFLTFDFPVACKTGTSSDYRDNWCFGYTLEFTVGVWVGNPDGTPMQGITGVTGAGPIMHEIMQHLHDTRGTSWFAQPTGVTAYTVDPLTGRLAPPGRPSAIEAQCLHAPEPARPEDYDAEGRVRLPAIYAEWLAGPQNNLGSLAAAGAPGAFQILEPVAGSIYYLDHDLPADSQWIPLRASGAGVMQWSSGSLAMQTSHSGSRARLREGTHTISVHDAASGKEATTWIEVKPW
jgi:penicillin-binding protein 1C